MNKYYHDVIVVTTFTIMIVIGLIYSLEISDIVEQKEQNNEKVVIDQNFVNYSDFLNLSPYEQHYVINYCGGMSVISGGVEYVCGGVSS